MRLVEAAPNQTGGIDRLFLLVGDCVNGPINHIENADLLPASSGLGRLKIFHFNDLHNHLTELSGATAGTHRFAQMVKIVGDARASKTPDEAVLFLSIGDDHTGSVLDELLGWTPEQFRMDSSYRAYSAGGVDATVLGNHEFDRGTELLAKSIQQDAAFPVLSANVHSSAHLISGPDYSPAAIAIAGGLRIGLLGLTTHVETRVGQPSDPAFDVASPILVLQNILPVLADLADVVLILSHCGFGEGAHQSGKAAAVRDIGEADFSIAQAATAITERPLILLGAHTHTKLNEVALEKSNVIGRVPVFQAECNGRYLGQIDLQIDPQLSAGYAVLKTCLHRIKPRNDSVVPGDENFDLVEQPDDYDQEFESKTIAPMIAQMKDVLTSQIAQIKTDQLSFKSAALDRYAGECGLLNFMGDTIVSRLEQAGFSVDFSLVNGATILAGIEPGPLGMGAWFDVVPYADEIFIVQITGAELEKILDNNAKRLLRPEEVPEIDYTGFVGRGFLHGSHQIRYQIDPARSARSARAFDVEIDGRPISDLQSRVFKIAMPTYLALGGFGERWNGRNICGGVPGDLEGYDLRRHPAESTGLIYRNEIATHIAESGEINDAQGSFRDGRLKILPQTKGQN